MKFFVDRFCSNIASVFLNMCSFYNAHKTRGFQGQLPLQNHSNVRLFLCVPSSPITASIGAMPITQLLFLTRTKSLKSRQITYLQTHFAPKFFTKNRKHKVVSLWQSPQHSVKKRKYFDIKAPGSAITSRQNFLYLQKMIHGVVAFQAMTTNMTVSREMTV